MATLLPRNRGLKTRGHRSKTRDSVPFRYASAATLTQYPHSSVPNRHASFIIIHRLRVQEPSVTRQGGRPRRPSSPFPPIPIPSHHRYSSAPQPFNRRRTAYFDKKNNPCYRCFVAGVILFQSECCGTLHYFLVLPGLLAEGCDAVAEGSNLALGVGKLLALTSHNSFRCLAHEALVAELLLD